MAKRKKVANFVPPTKAEWEAMFPKNMEAQFVIERRAIANRSREMIAQWVKESFAEANGCMIEPTTSENTKTVQKHNLFAFYCGMYTGLSMTIGKDIDECQAEIDALVGLKLPESPSNAAGRAEFEADPLKWEEEAMAQ